MKAKIASFPSMTVNALTDVLEAHGLEVLHMGHTHVPARATASPGPYVLIREDYQFLPLNKDVLVLKEFSACSYNRGQVTLCPGDTIRLWHAGTPASPSVWSVERAELVGPNAHEYEQCVERFYEDEGRREAHRIRYNLEHA